VADTQATLLPRTTNRSRTSASGWAVPRPWSRWPSTRTCCRETRSGRHTIRRAGRGGV